MFANSARSGQERKFMREKDIPTAPGRPDSERQDEELERFQVKAPRAHIY